MSTPKAPSSAQVIIVGAGPTGLVAALALLQNGISVRVVEKNVDAHVGQRGAGIQPRTLEVFRLLGVLPDFQKWGAHGPPMQAYEFGGAEPLKTWEAAPLLEPTPDRPYPNSMHIGQDRTQGILTEHLRAYGCVVESGTSLQAFEQHPDRVVVHLLKEESGRALEETVSASFLLGSDGARGIVRKQLGLAFFGESRTAERFATGDVRITGLSRAFWRFYGNADTAQLSLRPAEDPADPLFTYSIWGKDVDSKALAADRTALLAFLRAATSGAHPGLAFDLVNVNEFAPNVRMVDKFGEGRVFVAGDAAHVHSPTGGQGLNSSVHDALNFATKLATVLKHDLAVPNALLDAYTAERRPVIAAMLAQTTALLDKTFQSKKGEYGAWKRGGALGMLGVNYRGSLIVLDQRTVTRADDGGSPYDNGDDRICAGDRAPDASGLQDADRSSLALFDIFKVSLHTVLVFGRADLRTQVSSALQSLVSTGDVQIKGILPAGTAGGALDLEDKEGHAYRGYAVEQNVDTIVVVRPDGFIGAIVFDVKGLGVYFRNIFGADCLTVM
ncbi:hypothetical protein HWV62_4691 [Athelia sp. TMB]|nr:hypothetical protein HWV62_4691 [Athelia sp. TMB]